MGGHALERFVMFTELAEKWKKEFNSKVPNQPLDLNEWGAIVAFCWWLDKRFLPTKRATDAGCDVCRDGVPGWDE